MSKQKGNSSLGSQDGVKAPVRAGGIGAAGSAPRILRLLFEKSLADPYFDVAPEGQRFVMIEEGEAQPALTQLILGQNWGEELKRLVPTN